MGRILFLGVLPKRQAFVFIYRYTEYSIFDAFEKIIGNLQFFAGEFAGFHCSCFKIDGKQIILKIF
jgi:hypothetical protein